MSGLAHAPAAPLYIGLMSGTSLDGVDGVLVSIPADYAGGALPLLATSYTAFPPDLRTELLALQAPGNDEIAREAQTANKLAHLYAECIRHLLTQSGKTPSEITAIGVHGQTIRHRPDVGFTRQSNNPALLAELSGISVVADFRSRDIAAGGQGAPLVPAFHQMFFRHADKATVIVNIGGIANVSILHAPGKTGGFDTGPGNVLMDTWIQKNRNLPYDEGGKWALTGKTQEALLAEMRKEAFFHLPPPKSTGRDLFNAEWLGRQLRAFPGVMALDPADIQATLLALTGSSITSAIHLHAPATERVIVCGGGARNGALMQWLRDRLQQIRQDITVQTSDDIGISAAHVEALAFAWLAHRFVCRLPGNLPAVTGARGARILGALYPGGPT
ncbi:MAG: anhydro-N-acetylmuramic acid kinase [Burkholderiaceae bacterium]|nr:anhydro-N-acetylmuramic acid kinase [Burkholderiaceae bacterium]